MEKLDCLKIHAVVFSLPSFFRQKWNIWKIVFLSQLSVSSCCCCFFVFPRIGHFSLKIAIFWGRGFEPGPLTLASASWSRKQNSTTEQGPKGSIRSLRYWVTQLHCGKDGKSFWLLGYCVTWLRSKGWILFTRSAPGSVFKFYSTDIFLKSVFQHFGKPLSSFRLIFHL